MPRGHAKNGFSSAIPIGAPTLTSFVDKYGALDGCIAFNVIYEQEGKTMQKTVINEVFDVLRGINAVDSESEFARDWLGRSECYLRTLRFKGAEPSVATIAICASKLQHYGNQLIKQRQHEALGRQFLSLSQQCHAQINQKSKALWLNP